MKQLWITESSQNQVNIQQYSFPDEPAPGVFSYFPSFP